MSDLTNYQKRAIENNVDGVEFKINFRRGSGLARHYARQLLISLFLKSKEDREEFKVTFFSGGVAENITGEECYHRLRKDYPDMAKTMDKCLAETETENRSLPEAKENISDVGGINT